MATGRADRGRLGAGPFRVAMRHWFPEWSRRERPIVKVVGRGPRAAGQSRVRRWARAMRERRPSAGIMSAISSGITPATRYLIALWVWLERFFWQRTAA